MLVRPPHLQFPAVAESVFNRVDLSIPAGDPMHQGRDAHYLSVGANALNVIDAALRVAEVKEIRKILDYGCGAGRVTRWLRAAYPSAEISATDLRESDLQFCAEHFDVATWQSGTDLQTLAAPDRYDLIWVGSVLTHLSSDASLALLHKLTEWLREDGILIVSLHGRAAIANHDRNGAAYLHSSGWRTIMDEYRKTGYGYADYENQIGYGISLASLDWIARQVLSIPNVRLILLSERAWDNHHDILALQAVRDE